MNCPLLHNMSARPTVVLQHESAVDAGNLVVFELPPPLARRPRTLLEAMDGTPFRGAKSKVEAALRERINQRARELPWPAVALAVDQAPGECRRCPDLLTVVTALSKTGQRVYLRDKEPNLPGLASRRRVILRLPPTKDTAL